MRRANSSPDPAPEALVDRAAGMAKWQQLLTVTATWLVLFAVVAIVVRLGLAIHHTLLLFALGGLTAYALSPLVSLVQRARFGKRRRRLSNAEGAFVVYIVLFAVIAGGVWWAGDQAGREVRILGKFAPTYRERGIEYAHNFDEQVLRPRGITFSLEDSLQTPPPEFTSFAERLSGQAVPIIAHTLATIAEAGVVLLIALYMLIFSSDMKEKMNAALSPTLRAYVVPWETDVNRILGGFVRGQLILAVLYGACAAFGLWIVGIHLWLIIGLFVVVASLIPVFGPYIAGIPAVLAALLGGEYQRLTPMWSAIYVVVLFVIINEVGSKVLYPKLVGGALNLHEVAVLFVLFAGLEVGGIVGALLAAPIAALSIVTVIHLYRMWQELPEVSVADAMQKRSLQGQSKTAPDGVQDR